MNKQPTRRRGASRTAARSLAFTVAVAAQVAPTPVGVTPAGSRGGLVVVVVVAALLLAVGAATTWRVRHHRPQPESTA